VCVSFGGVFSVGRLVGPWQGKEVWRYIIRGFLCGEWVVSWPSRSRSGGGGVSFVGVHGRLVGPWQGKEVWRYI
jgi:hypothetical protein